MEDAPVLDRPAPLRRFYAIPVPNTNAVTCLLYLLTSGEGVSFSADKNMPLATF